MEELALHILDVAENSVAAGARSVEIRVTEEIAQDRLVIEVADDGRGMEEPVRRRAADPFFTTRATRRVGLGLSLLEQAARATGGELFLESAPLRGTKVTAVFRHSHPDRQPLGDMAATLLALAAGHPEADFRYEHRRDGEVARFDTRDVRRAAPGTALNSPAGIAALRRALEKALGSQPFAKEGNRNGSGDD